MALFDLKYQSLLRSIYARPIQHFFITGVQKSGTSWFQTLVNNHPEIGIKKQGEGLLIESFLNFFQRFAEDFNGSISCYRINNSDVNFITRFFVDCILLQNTEDASIRILGEKSPDTRFYLERIGEIFPNAKIFNVLRDGRDVVVSRFFHDLRFHRERMMKEYGHQIQNSPNRLPDQLVVEYLYWWKRGVQTIAEARKKAPLSFFDIRYEDLLADRKTVLKDAFEFLGVSDSEEIVSACAEAGAFKNFSNGRMRGVEDRESFFRKGISGDWENYFTDRQRDAVEALFGDFLRSLGIQRREC